jgi:colanic acid/amylovoran biosynthesis glycosyltransferase
MKIAFVLPKKNILTETFIQNHVDLLQGEKLIYNGGFVPAFLGDKKLSVHFGISQRIQNRIPGMRAKDHLTYAQRAFYQSLMETKPDVVLAEYGVTGASILPIVKELGIPLVVHFHGYDASKFDILKQYKAAYEEMFQYAQAVVAVSRQMTDKLISLGAPKEKVVYNCYGPKDIFFSIQPTYQKSIFLCVGRFVEKKSHHLTILAFHKMMDKHPDSKLVLIGDGPFKLFCEDLVKSLGMTARVEFSGPLGHEEVHRKLAESLCFVQHSRIAESGDMEGTPLSILEAQAAGIPVVSTFHAGIPDVVLNNETGYLVEENDIEGMAVAMDKILSDRTKTIAMGQAAKQRYKTHFTLTRHIDILQIVLENAVNKSHRAS